MVDREKDIEFKGEMAVSEAGHKGGERVKELIEAAKEKGRNQQQA